ncbi:LysR family transcriptional regulator [Noviherbaspirillum suwonense]|jgi:DNA-binding transcriptional LysR family regulator|uniref:Transcriptional regulator, LysR family n=1 Tax=Noviherbaspirillum suwonense TaxID=1224511 RepID=A0ABY1QBE8_9BURK|nr:LysR family transcriptional regulator [Noviherbaspirillum suwonense]SMP66550.1 transcriptional regulator, LysR family [Noviherbaspirillum suwonense]
MELRHLRYFVAVAEERNFTRAAERLHIAQPPLSRQIQQLEEMVGVALVVRGSRPLELTEAGHFFYGHAVQLLAQGAEVLSMTRRIGKIERKFSIGFVGSTLFGFLPEVVRRFKAAQPTTEVTLHEMTTMEQIKGLKEGRIDVGIGRIRHEDPNIRRILLREEALIAALPMGHPLSFLDRGLYLREFVNDKLIVFPKTPRPSFADQVLAAFRDHGLSPVDTLEVRELQVALGLVAAGMGVSIVPKSVLGLKRSDVCYKPMDEPNLTSPIIMSIRALDKSEAIRSLLDLIYSLYRSEGVPHTQETLDD